MSTFDLNEYGVSGGSISNISTGSVASDSPAVVRDGGKLVAVVMNVTLDPGADTTFDIVKNTVDTTIDVTLLDGQTADTGVRLGVPGLVSVVPGDVLTITSNNEATGAAVAEVLFVIRR